jgi:hypothetical protein
LGNHDIARKYEFITELLTAFIDNYITYYRKNMDSTINDIANWKITKIRSLAAEFAIMIRYYYQTAKSRALFESTDGPTGRPGDNPPDSARL